MFQNLHLYFGHSESCCSVVRILYLGDLLKKPQCCWCWLPCTRVGVKPQMEDGNISKYITIESPTMTGIPIITHRLILHNHICEYSIFVWPKYTPEPYFSLSNNIYKLNNQNYLFYVQDVISPCQDVSIYISSNTIVNRVHNSTLKFTHTI